MFFQVVLSACSTYFDKIFSEHEEKDPVVILKDVKFVDIKALVEFMYKGEINVENVSKNFPYFFPTCLTLSCNLIRFMSSCKSFRTRTWWEIDKVFLSLPFPSPSLPPLPALLPAPSHHRIDFANLKNRTCREKVNLFLFFPMVRTLTLLIIKMSVRECYSRRRRPQFISRL